MFHFLRLGPLFELIMDSDASHANLEDRSAQIGMFIFLKGKINLLPAILGQSK